MESAGASPLACRGHLADLINFANFLAIDSKNFDSEVGQNSSFSTELRCRR